MAASRFMAKTTTQNVNYAHKLTFAMVKTLKIRPIMKTDVVYF